MSEPLDKPPLKQAAPSDHLANERTYLAWIRTSIGVMAFGFLIVKFSMFLEQLHFFTGQQSTDHGHDYASLAGVFMVIFGGVILILSYSRYKNVMKQLTMGNFHPTNNMLNYITVGLMIVVVMLIVYLIAFSI